MIPPHCCALRTSNAHCDWNKGTRDAGSATGVDIAGCRHPMPSAGADGLGVTSCTWCSPLLPCRAAAPRCCCSAPLLPSAWSPPPSFLAPPVWSASQTGTMGDTTSGDRSGIGALPSPHTAGGAPVPALATACSSCSDAGACFWRRLGGRFLHPGREAATFISIDRWAGGLLILLSLSAIPFLRWLALSSAWLASAETTCVHAVLVGWLCYAYFKRSTGEWVAAFGGGVGMDGGDSLERDLHGRRSLHASWDACGQFLTSEALIGLGSATVLGCVIEDSIWYPRFPLENVSPITSLGLGSVLHRCHASFGATLFTNTSWELGIVRLMSHKYFGLQNVN